MKKNIATEIEELVLPITDANNLELVDVEYVKEGGEFFLRIYIDKDGGVSLNECELVTRALNPILDENFSLFSKLLSSFLYILTHKNLLYHSLAILEMWK